MTDDTAAAPGRVDASGARRMRLRYAGRCRVCSTDLAVGTTAQYDPAARAVTCLTCSEASPAVPAAGLPASPAQAPPPVGAAAGAMDADAEVVAVDPVLDEPAVLGTAGASARREHERRKAKRENRIREAHPHLGGLILALTDDPQSTKAWSTGARGEERLAQRLDGLTEHGVRLLHDRRIPKTRANIDHIAVAPTGVYVIDAKRYQGRPHLRVEGGILRPRVEKLMVGTRDCTKLVAGVQHQASLVKDALAAAGQDVPVTGVLCFVEADWPLIGGDFTTAGVRVLWPKKAAQLLTSAGPLTPDAVRAAHVSLSAAFPAA